jgi:hypothetical protein
MSRTHLVIPDLCSKCGIGVRKKTSVWCQPCANAYEKVRWASLSYADKKTKHLKSRYGLDYEWFMKTLEDQNNSCKICAVELVLDFNSSNRACVDHNHETGKVRGILCNHCNRAIGLLRDDVKILNNALRYLEKNNE